MPIPIEILQQHYQEYAGRPDEHVAKRAAIKLHLVQTVLEASGFKPEADPVKVAVLGASDKRYIPIHRRIFEEVVGKRVDMTTFDLEIEHLARQEGIIEHDITKPFPNTPYDLVFSHELMKFLDQYEQICAIYNAFNALRNGGLAMHIIHAPAIFGTADLRSWQYRVDPSQLAEVLQRTNMPTGLNSFDDPESISWFTLTKVITIQKRGDN